MAVKFGVFVPQGWKMDLIGIPDPVEQYETMTRVGQAAEAAGFDSIWVYDHFHTVPTPTQGQPSSAGRSPPAWRAIRSE